MKHSFRKIMAHIVAGAMVLGLAVGAFPTSVKATAPCAQISGNNAESQNYSVHAAPSNSALAPLSDGRLMSVTRSDDGKVVIMYFNSSYELTATRYITPVLPVYGGFFASTDGYYYLATGQNNPDESDSVEVYRITKYDSNWNEIAHASLFGSNTESPYHAGSCDFAEDGKYLLVRTCHRMYQSDDGLNHQANVTIQIDTTDMSILCSHYTVANTSVGYVSHSFNQFIRNDNGYAVAVDHGDAYPRAVVIGKYDTPISDGITGGWSKRFTYVSALEIPGATGANATGVSIGGFEVSSTSYLIAVNTVNMSGTYNASGIRNAAIISVPKTSGGFGTPVLRTLTNYAQGENSASTPRLVKINDNSFLVLWSRNGSVYYTQVDGSGNPGTTYSFKGALSDCNPVIYNGNVVWYVYDEGDTDFYRISTSNISQNSVAHVITGHHYVYQGTNDGVATMVCDKCGDTFSKTTASSITVFGKLSGQSGSYWTNFTTTLNMDEEMLFLYRFSPDDAEDTTLEVVIENPNILVYNPSERKLTPLYPGTTTVTFRMKYNPTVQRTYTFTVEGEIPEDDENNNTSNNQDDNNTDINNTDTNNETTNQNNTSNSNTNTNTNNNQTTNQNSNSNTSNSNTNNNNTTTNQNTNSNTNNSNTNNSNTNTNANTNNSNTNTNNNQTTDQNTNTNTGVDTSSLDCKWYNENGKSYWYEHGIRQGTYGDPNGVIGDGTVRGREIYDPASDGWYWLDSIYNGAKATGKEVWMPYIYQDEKNWDEETMRRIAYESDEGMGECVLNAMLNNSGKWVRYDENGRMLKGWVTIEGTLATIYPDQEGNTYYYDHRTGLMAKGTVTIDGTTYYFDEITGALQ